ncbi:phosphate/phosphite/phosphonate ABC transporter substrate-binding protein [Pseudooceanicola aestuarii]|uniref:phosphate/phosphite/phosphonate ABC transporter substrate-binding protein n=1 Tax=Pseudooceanicola aestuarii TaxID=2697319 RepID=UPI001EF8EF5B|nr:PhnD/SsuA/transferrin family substrate-binding protein [Pseudooceanicola aestuarii]
MTDGPTGRAGSGLIAALPMYDRPGTRSAHDRLWQLIARDLPGAPAALTRPSDPWQVWTSPDLLLAQTCGLPYREILHDRVTLVATPVHDLPCPPGQYDSVLIARADDRRQTLADFDGAAFAYNEGLSQSGWAAPMTALRAAAVQPGDFLETGAHAASARAVASGAADLAGIDAVTWAILRDHDPAPAALRVIGRSAASPALPWITARDRDPDPIRRALARAIADLSADDRSTLHLSGMTLVPSATYLAQRDRFVAPRRKGNA